MRALHRLALVSLAAFLVASCGGGATTPSVDPDGSAPVDAGRDASLDGGRLDGGGIDAGPCTSDTQCADGLFCDGVERCESGVCTPAADSACPGAECDEAADTCSALCVDVDLDGACSEVDCDDLDPARYPGATERCDHVDQDCDPATLGADGDGDTYPSTECCNPQLDGSLLCGGDCDDTRATVNPTAVEACNGVDDDCIGTIDDGLPTSSYYPDCDGDLYGAAVLAESVGCAPPTSPPSCPAGSASAWATDPSDCDDAVAAVHPGATEVCNGIDDNCIGGVDEDVLLPWYVDADGDGHGALGSAAVMACGAPAGYVGSHDDCDDSDGAVHPGAAEICDNVDNDCDGGTDVGCPCRLGATQDCGATLPGGGFYTNSPCHPGTQTCVRDTTATSSTWTACAGNHDPASVESCATAEDDNCDGFVNESTAGDATDWYPDVDGDTFGSATATAVRACLSPGLGYVHDHTDCDDGVNATHPGAVEVCNGLDDNCVNGVDEGLATFGLLPDCDRDGYGVGATPVLGCVPLTAPLACPAGGWATASERDCNDAEGAIHPGAVEVCNLIDDNCSGFPDEGVLTA